MKQESKRVVERDQNKTENISKSNSEQNEKVTEALEQAEADMEQDPDLNIEPDPAADLDEGELARLEGEDDRYKVKIP